MTTTQELRLWRGLATFFFLALACGVRADGDSVQSKEIEGATAKIQWGKHWAGPEIAGAKSLEGKVVLLKIWGG